MVWTSLIDLQFTESSHFFHFYQRKTLIGRLLFLVLNLSTPIVLNVSRLQLFFLIQNVCSADFSDQFRKYIIRYKRIGYNINVKRQQSSCLVGSPITVNIFASLFKCTPVGRASGSVMDSI